MIEIKKTILKPDSTFKFNCHSNIGCFKKCCSSRKITLSPYDILLMKKRLGISSEEFLEKYTYYSIDEKTSLIFVILRMRNDEERTCFFTGPEGCSIYADRPVQCRYFPLGEIFMKTHLSKELSYDVSYFLEEESICLGFQEDREWTIETWRKNHGVEIFDEFNREWKEIIMAANISGESDQAQMYIASYDIDRFRRFISKSGFFDVIYYDEEKINKVKIDDIELMKFGFRYLKHMFNIEKTLKIKEDKQLQFNRIIRGIMQI